MMGIEGVLAQPPEPGQLFAAANPINTGVALMKVLSESHRIVLATTHADRGSVDHWLRQQGLTSFYGALLLREAIEADLTYEALRASQFARLRGLGGYVHLVIDADPVVIGHVMREGTVGLLFAHPVYMRPEFRPDSARGARAWQDIADEVEHQNLLKATDVRLDVLGAESAEAAIEDEDDVEEAVRL